MHSFGRYATAQLRRLENALTRDNYPQAEKEKHILDSLKNQMYHFQEKYTEFTGESIRLYLDKSDKEEFDEEIFMDITLTHYPLRDFHGIYSEMSNVVKDYSKLNNRNKKKDDKHLNKHAMHLIRLLLMGSRYWKARELILTEAMTEVFVEIRNGKFKKMVIQTEFFDLVDVLEKITVCSRKFIVAIKAGL